MNRSRAMLPLYAYNGEEHDLREWAKKPECRVPYEILRNRVKDYGWPIGDALTVPVGAPRLQNDLCAKCRGCRYLGETSGMPYCNYAGITGHPRTVYRGIKTDRCPRRGGTPRKRG